MWLLLEPLLKEGESHGLLYCILTTMKQSKDAREPDNVEASKVRGGAGEQDTRGGWWVGHGWVGQKEEVLMGEDNCVMGCEGRTVFCQLLLYDNAEFVLIVFLLSLHAANLCNV